MLSACSLRKAVNDHSHTNTRDSVRIAYLERVDSVYIDRWHNVTTKGDTIVKTDSVTLYKYIRVYSVDTVVVNKTDTIRTVETRYIEKAKKTPLKDFCLYMFLALSAIIAALILWKRYTKK